MKHKKLLLATLFIPLLVGHAGCTTSPEAEIPEGAYGYGDDRNSDIQEPGLRIAALDYNLGDLTDPSELAKYTRADILIVATWQVWDYAKDINLIRAANPDLKILAYFRTKCIRSEWSIPPATGRRYTHDLYQAGAPFLSFTTTGDTLSDWPNALVIDYTNPTARKALLDVFVDYQTHSPFKFDGVFWDYFSKSLWIAPTVTGMTGEPDMDGDSVPHWDDPDELAAFVAAQDDFVDEMRAAMGPNFIQIANGVRALQDSTFAAKFDGMFYENFPNQGLVGGPGFRLALDPSVPNNLWAARTWPRTRNGGPWLILSYMHHVGTYLDGDGEYQTIDGDDLTRATALLTDATAITYEGFGVRDAGVPTVEYGLGQPLGGVVVTGDTYSREFENGRIDLYMGSGDYPVPFEFTVWEGGRVAHDLDLPTMDR